MTLDLPALCIGLIVASYWARVIKLVFKTRRTVGKAGNFVPPEPLGRALRIIWYPTVALWIALPLLAAFAAGKLPHVAQPLFRSMTVSWLAVLIALCAFIATLICWKRMGKSWRMGIDPDEKTTLIVKGPYAFVRNPIYTLSSTLMVASVIAVPSVLMMVVGAIHLLFLQWEVRREEKYLLQTHGEEYRRYYQAVGRFLPKSLRPFE